MAQKAPQARAWPAWPSPACSHNPRTAGESDEQEAWTSGLREKMRVDAPPLGRCDQEWQWEKEYGFYHGGCFCSVWMSSPFES